MKNGIASLAILLLAMPWSVAQTNQLVLPFRQAGNLILIQAVVDGQTGFFVLDTGVGPLILNRRHFRGTSTEKVFFDVKGRAFPVEERHVSLDLGQGWSFPGLVAEIVDLRAVEVHTGLPVFGNIGAALFEGCELVIDYVFGELTIYRLSPAGQPLAGREIHGQPVETLDLRFKGKMPVLKGMIGKNRVYLALDTGAGVNIVGNHSRKKVAEMLQLTGAEHLAGFGNESGRTHTGFLSGVVLGKLFCPPMKTYLASLNRLNNELHGPAIDGILGYEFLSNYRVGLNFKTHKVRIWPPEMVREQYLAAYQGSAPKNR